MTNWKKTGVFANIPVTFTKNSNIIIFDLRNRFTWPIDNPKVTPMSLPLKFNKWMATKNSFSINCWYLGYVRTDTKHFPTGPFVKKFENMNNRTKAFCLISEMFLFGQTLDFDILFFSFG